MISAWTRSAAAGTTSLSRNKTKEISERRRKATTYFSLRRSGARFDGCPLLERFGLRLRELDLDERRTIWMETGRGFLDRRRNWAGMGVFSLVSARSCLQTWAVEDQRGIRLSERSARFLARSSTIKSVCWWRSSERFLSIYASIERSFVRLCVCVCVCQCPSSLWTKNTDTERRQIETSQSESCNSKNRKTLSYFPRRWRRRRISQS